MPMVKKSASEVATEPSVTELVRKEPLKTTPKFQGRDFDAEARGKTRCSLFAAALQSPVLQQYLYTKSNEKLEDLLNIVKEVADAGVKYTFGD